MPDTMTVNGAEYTVLHLLGKGKFSGGQIMSKRTRQCIGILAALAAYYLVHEGTHLLYALLTGVFKQIRFMGLGVQIDVCAERMTDTQLGIFCLVGALATFCVGYLLTVLAKNICCARSKLLLANGLVFWKRVLPAYQQSFSEQ